MGNEDIKGNVVSLFTRKNISISAEPQHRNSITSQNGLVDVVIDTFEPFREYEGAELSIARAKRKHTRDGTDLLGGDFIKAGAHSPEFYENFMRQTDIPLDMHVESLECNKGVYVHNISLYQGHEEVELEQSVQERVDECNQMANITWYISDRIPEEHSGEKFVSKYFMIKGVEKKLFALKEDVSEAWHAVLSSVRKLEDIKDKEGRTQDVSLDFRYFMGMTAGVVEMSPNPRFSDEEPIKWGFFESRVYCTSCDRDDPRTSLKDDMFDTVNTQPKNAGQLSLIYGGKKRLAKTLPEELR